MSKHVADELKKEKKIIYPAFSKRNFYYREHISKFVLEQDCVPLNPFMIFNYYMLDTVSRDKVREANNNLVRISDEVWAFGEIADGVASEIRYAKKTGKAIRYFSLKNLPDQMTEIKEIEVMFESGLGQDDLKP
ncbi:MAG: hypothetical protein Q8N98_00010 [bacterium]|nr:hypothetical protein [bacterium]